MNTRAPSVIYRTRSLADAKSLADYLGLHAFDARLAVENPHGYFGELPITDFVHEVMAANYDTEKLNRCVLEWERLQCEQKHAAAKPYCYHCGLPVLESSVSCGNCGKSLDRAD